MAGRQGAERWHVSTLCSWPEACDQRLQAPPALTGSTFEPLPCKLLLSDMLSHHRKLVHGLHEMHSRHALLWSAVKSMFPSFLTICSFVQNYNLTAGLTCGVKFTVPSTMSPSILTSCSSSSSLVYVFFLVSCLMEATSALKSESRSPVVTLSLTRETCVLPSIP